MSYPPDFMVPSTPRPFLRRWEPLSRPAGAWRVLAVLCSVFACAAPSLAQKPSSTDPAFRQNVVIWIAAADTGLEEVGSEDKPFIIGRNGVTFDRFMSRFNGVVNVTFCFKKGVYVTSGIFEVLPGNKPPQDAWEPGTGWRMLGAGTNETFLVMEDPKETQPTKFVVIGNPHSGRLATVGAA